MYSTKYLIKAIKCFLPHQGKLLQIQEGYYQTPAVLQGDIDGDGIAEILGLYEKEQKSYILILKRVEERWEPIWNSKIDFYPITLLKLGRFLPQKGRQLVLGGHQEKQNNFMLFEWEENELVCMLAQEEPFDKLYVQDIGELDGIDEMIVWRHKVLEAYDIKLYKYENYQLIEERSLEPYYFRIVMNYYTYLCDNAPEEVIYKEALLEAKKRYEARRDVHKEEIPHFTEEIKEEEIKEEEIKGEEMQEDVEEPKEQVMKHPSRAFEKEEALQGPIEETIENKMPQQASRILIGTTACLEKVGVEEEIYLVGEKMNADTSAIKQLKLLFTTKDKTYHHMVDLQQEEIYTYKIFTGDFTGDGLEDVFLQFQAVPSMQKCTYIYTCSKGYLKEILKREDNPHKLIYPIEIALEDKYEIYCEEDQVGEWVRWDGNKFYTYKKCTILHQGNEG